RETGPFPLATPPCISAIRPGRRPDKGIALRPLGIILRHRGRSWDYYGCGFCFAVSSRQLYLTISDDHIILIE
ncbi:MAG: hypothetical protein D3904_04760, partial [Candidatus Electrothrix sp. EH2]|nr:hypothetical protein [Candidatus Electrothrix sp. EH2]